MEDTKEERDHAAAVIQNSVPNVYVLDLAQPRVAGGSALPAFFNFVLSRSRFDITVFADTDAFVLATGWDDMLEQMFADPDMGLAAINPRSTSDEFADNVRGKSATHARQPPDFLLCAGGVELDGIAHAPVQPRKLLRACRWPTRLPRLGPHVLAPRAAFGHAPVLLAVCAHAREGRYCCG